ncbi:type III effector protein [Actinoplanes solisilvae]|uniref:type III effector protein n=1 Tax=Actinoplanes solisilvae TaxID=2486853 RepID=UPI000FD84F00|nr:type III effector protein [Actinoplanes solisilvae]
MTDERDLAAVAAALAGTADAVRRNEPVSPADLLDALVLLRRAQAELTALEPVLIAAARAAGVSWASLAPVLGVSSRQAAERRYLRGTTAGAGATQDARVQAERDRRAANRAVTRWANDNTADLRRLAGQVTALTDLGDAATESLGRLHDALGDADASALPGLLADTRRHLPRHPKLSAQIDAVTEQTAEIRRRPARQHLEEPGGAGSE